MADRLSEALALQAQLLKQWKAIPFPRSENRSARALEAAMFGVSQAIQALETEIKAAEAA